MSTRPPSPPAAGAAAGRRPAAAAAAPTPARGPRFTGIGALVFGLAVVLVAVVAVQARQFAVLREAFDLGDEGAVIAVHRAQTAALALRAQWLSVADERVPMDVTALREHGRDFARSLDAVRDEPVRRLLGDGVDATAPLQVADRLNEATARALADTAAPARSRLDALRPQLDAVKPAMAALSEHAARRVAAQAQQRQQAVTRQNQTGFVLTVLLALSTLAFALLALRHVRRLRGRRRVLEELTTQLRLARGDAEAASTAKSVFLANMSHEIRTPFHGLLGMLSLLRETGLNARQIDYLRTASESADHLLALLNDILDMSQLESGRMVLRPVAMDVRALLRDVEALMRPQAQAKSLALHIDADPQVPDRVLADATRVRQVIFNLLSNAIKFSDRGAVVLDVRVQRSAGAAPELDFVVTDNGTGMDDATLAGLFKRFVQGDGSSSRRHGGSGLGLEISRDLARLMGGDITVQSRPGAGSQFSFRMPCAAVAEPQPPARGHAALAASDAVAGSLRVLVAEDHPVNRQYLAALLDNMGHKAHFTAHGQEAVQAVREHRFDVVLMDLHMPVLDGVAATRAIRGLPDAAVAGVPIVALTADAFAETRERCLLAGMNGFLTKPVSPDDLATALRRLFGAAGAGAAGADDRAAEAMPAVTARGALPSVAEGLPLIDRSALDALRQVMPRERLAAMLEHFIVQSAETVRRLQAAVRAAEAQEIRANAHAAHGAALNLGLPALAATAEALHDGAAHLPAHEVALLVRRYEELLPATRQALRESGLAAP